MELAHAFRINTGESLAFSGAGGKTTALFRLARQLEPPVLVTTTTHLSSEQIALADQTIKVDELIDLEDLFSILEPGVVILIGNEDQDDRVKGLPEWQLKRVAEIAQRRKITLLIEADGSRQRPLKAPAGHEPVIPSYVDHVVVVAGLSALGKPLNEQWVHRVEHFSDLSGLVEGEQISTAAITRVLLDLSGGLKGIPAGAKKMCLLNQADDTQLQAQANRIARSLIPEYEAVIVASLNHGSAGATGDVKPIEEEEVLAVYEPIAGIILAAGGSDRMGRVKQLLPWRGEPLVQHVVRIAITSGLTPVVVVVGDAGEEVKNVLADQPVILVDNPDWRLGQSSSLQVGLKALPAITGAAVFFLADMPQIPGPLIQALKEQHAMTLSPVIAPLVDGQRGNPVLLDRKTFTDLGKLKGDKGGRGLFSKYPVSWVEWHDSTALNDVDTEEDYQRLLSEDD
ncbi:selenium cofactor biosynthesis protein YqeC [Chloroflexota bacterium]